MNRYFYTDSITGFRNASPEQILGHLAANNPFTLETTQRQTWLEEIDLLQTVFVLEFKIGEKEFTASALDQVCDYALDLKNFHESS